MRGRIRLKEIKAQAHAAAVEAREALAQSREVLTTADRTMLEMKALASTAIEAWTEVAEELLDGVTLKAGAEKNALSKLFAMVKSGEKAELPFYLAVYLRDEDGKDG